MIKKWLHKYLNKKGYYKINQLKIGGTCGCCGKSIHNLIYADYGDNWDDIGLCNDCKQEGKDIVCTVQYNNGDIFTYYKHVYDQERKDIEGVAETLENAKYINFKEKYKNFI